MRNNWHAIFHFQLEAPEHKSLYLKIYRIEAIDQNSTDSLGDLYSETQVGQCLNTVLNEMMMEGDININQQMALRRAYNYVHHQSFEQCQNKLHLNVSGKLTEFSSLSNSSSFTVKVRIPILII